MDLQRWALNQSKLHPNSDDADYALGVIMAINVSQMKSAPLNSASLERQPQETQFDYMSGIALMNKVVELGDAPAGEFRELLDAPYVEPLTSAGKKERTTRSSSGWRADSSG